MSENYDREIKKLQLENTALLERVASLTSEYEQKIAKMRVEVTMILEDINNANDAEEAPDAE